MVQKPHNQGMSSMYSQLRTINYCVIFSIFFVKKMINILNTTTAFELTVDHPRLLIPLFAT